jgi:serine phosphatase RsbU (regulator of sigma subunit)
VESLITANSSRSAQSIIDILVSEADQWLSGKHNPDDITIMVIKKE